MSSIRDNLDGNTLLHALTEICPDGKELRVASAFFSLDALFMLANSIENFDRIRILFGDDADATQRNKLLRKMQELSDADLLTQREASPLLTALQKIDRLFTEKKIEARCYTSKKFHAKAYLVDLAPGKYPYHWAISGSGNFTRPGLTQNIELNMMLSSEQTEHLSGWFEKRWEEAEEATKEVGIEVSRQITLYEPHVLYLKALTLWGNFQTGGEKTGINTALTQLLDPHQEEGYKQALSILEREHGVMICDGVGLGKSFIALALMEYYCRQGQNVLLIAPKSILESSWKGYLKQYLNRYRAPFGNISESPMTEFGYDPSVKPDKHEELLQLQEQAEVIVIDESHNFRTSNAQRYKNLMEIIKPLRERKKVIMLTATPINTAYRDLSNQFSLITHDTGSLGGYPIGQVRGAASELDRQDFQHTSLQQQMSLELIDTPSETLNRVLESVIIQRSRATCKSLAAAKNKTLLFPQRTDPTVIQVKIENQSSLYRHLISLSKRYFEETRNLLKLMKAEVDKAEKKGERALPVKQMKRLPKGIKLAAFLTEQYRRNPETAKGKKNYLDEVHLAGLVFTNTLKQLESSPVAFQSIIQNLGLGLISRLRFVCGEEASPIVAKHEEWVRTELFPEPGTDDLEEEDDELAEQGDTLDMAGGETDAWLDQAIKARGLAKKLAEFNAETFEVDRWQKDIEADLECLQEIHEATLVARLQPDPKLSKVAPQLKERIENGERILLFTQSQRTAEYLQKALKEILPDARTARIDSRVDQNIRAAVLSAFCPNYNPPATAPSVPKHLDILICTDVLSEGVNMQETNAIFSYDIHWNPVRLIQRIGRVDRRLDPDINPETHTFDIVNVLPPPEIDDIINLVGAVDNRTYKISKTLGLDVSFFKSTDPAGNLKEFNAHYDGANPPREIALAAYAHLSVEPPDARTQTLIEAVPPGAFGVWKHAPENSLFALYTLHAKAKETHDRPPYATEDDKKKFASLLGKPLLLLERANREPLTDPGEILTLLSHTTPGEKSGVPSDEDALKKRLGKLKEAARRAYQDVNLPSTIVPKLVLWIELRKGTTLPS